MLRKTIYIFLLFLFVASCADTFSSAKRGLTGSKADSGDEFLVKKKDPLILPPDFENLPTPDEQSTTMEEISTIEKTLETSVEETSPTSSSVEELILKKIQKR